MAVGHPAPPEGRRFSNIMFMTISCELEDWENESLKIKKFRWLSGDSKRTVCM